MKKNNMYKLLLVLSFCFTHITFTAIVDEPIEPEQSGTETSRTTTESIEEKEAEKQKLEAQKQGEINNLNRLFGELKNKGAKDRKKINSEIQQLTGTNVKLDPSSANFQEEKKQLQKATIQKYDHKISALSEQIKAAQDTTETISKDFENSFSDNGLSSHTSTPLSPIEMNKMRSSYESMSTDFKNALTNPDVLKNQFENNPGFLDEVTHLADPSTSARADLENFLENSPDSQTLINNMKIEADTIHALSQIKTSLEKITQNPEDHMAFIDRNDAIRSLESLTGIDIVGNNGIVKNFGDLTQNNLDEIYQKVADTYKAQEEPISQKQGSSDDQSNTNPQEAKATQTEIENNKLILYQVTPIIDHLKSFNLLTDEEINDLNDKVENVQKALTDGVLSKIRAAISEVINALKMLLAQVLLSANKLGSALNEKINNLRDIFNEFIENLNSESQTSNYSVLPTQQEIALNELGITEENPTWTQIKKAYRSESLASHPDKGGSPAAMQRVNNAYDVLKKTEGNLNILGLSGSPSWDEIKTAYREKSKNLSPDESASDIEHLDNAFDELKNGYKK